MGHAGHQRSEAPPLLRLRRGQRECAHGASVKSAEEGDNVLPSGVIARDLQRALDRLRAGVAVIEPVRAGHGRDLRQPLGDVYQTFIVEVGAGHVDQLGCLVLDRLYHLGMAVAGRNHGDAGGEVQKFVAVHILDPHAPASLGHHRIGARIAGRDQPVVRLDNPPRVRAGQGSAKLRAVLLVFRMFLGGGR
jgi:hypothetical protein